MRTAIECNFGAPLSDPSNAAFQTDIVNWGKISQRVYIWNYSASQCVLLFCSV